MDQEIDVKAIRTTLDMTQAELADAVGVDQGTVSKWENGSTPRGPARILLQQLLASHTPEPAQP